VCTRGCVLGVLGGCGGCGGGNTQKPNVTQHVSAVCVGGGGCVYLVVLGHRVCNHNRKSADRAPNAEEG